MITDSEGDRKRVERKGVRARKNQAISLRLSELDLGMVKNRTDQEGLPSQTLIIAIIHKYVTDQFYEKREVHKLLASLGCEHADETTGGTHGR